MKQTNKQTDKENPQTDKQSWQRHIHPQGCGIYLNHGYFRDLSSSSSALVMQFFIVFTFKFRAKYNE